MNIELIEKHVHLTQLPNGVEVMFGGQPCLTVSETFDGGYGWKINQLFAKMTYGANIFEDVPFCAESSDTIEEAVAMGLTKLHDLGAFHGVVDLPEDTYAEMNESFAVHDKSGKVVSVHGAESAAKQKAKELSTSTNQHTVKFAREASMTEAELFDSIKEDCRTIALKHSDSIMEAHDLAQGLFESVMHDLDEALTYKQKLHKLTVRPIASTAKELLGKVGEFGVNHDLTKDEHYTKSLTDANEYGKTKFAGKYEIAHEDQHGHKIRGGSIAKVRKGMNESVDEATLSGDAYWKAKEDAARELKAKEERAAVGIKEPVKKGRGKPTNIDLEFVHAKAKENVEAGKRPTTGMERNEKIHFVRHLVNHPDFAEKHVSAAGRPAGTTAAAKAEKVEKKKAETSAFSMWAGLGKK